MTVRRDRSAGGIGLDRPDDECGEQQREENVAGVMFDLEPIVREPLADRAQEHQDRRPGRSQPSSTDPQCSRQGRDSEEQGQETYGDFPGAQREHGDALDDQPPEWRGLTQPERTAELRKRAVAHIERDRFLVEPERARTKPLVDVQPEGDQPNHQRGSDVPVGHQRGNDVLVGSQMPSQRRETRGSQALPPGPLVVQRAPTAQPRRQCPHRQRAEQRNRDRVPGPPR